MTLDRSPVLLRRDRRLGSNGQSAVASTSTATDNGHPLASAPDHAPHLSKANRSGPNTKKNADGGKRKGDVLKSDVVDQVRSEDENSTPEKGEKNLPTASKGKRNVQKLDENAYRPWGGCSRSSSDTGSELAICRGGPFNMDCGNPVLDGQEGVQCECCSGWFHDTCQGIEIPAIRALDKYKILSWFCAECKVMIKKKDESKKLEALETQIQNIDAVVRKHIELVGDCLKKQEETSMVQSKQLEQNIKIFNDEKKTYAEILKGTCDQVVQKVSESVAALPTSSATELYPNAPGKSAQDISAVFDDFLDKEKRKLNVVVHNLRESESDTFKERSERDAALFTSMIKEVFKLSVTPVKTFRVGKKLPDKPRLLIVTLDSLATKYEILKLSSQLRNSVNFSGIYINPDMTQKEREQGKKLRDELAARRRAGEPNLAIRRGRIIQLDEGSAPTPLLCPYRSTEEPRKGPAPAALTLVNQDSNSSIREAGSGANQSSASGSGDVPTERQEDRTSRPVSACKRAGQN